MSLVVAVVAIALIFITAFRGNGGGGSSTGDNTALAAAPLTPTTAAYAGVSAPGEPTAVGVVETPSTTPIPTTPTPEPPTATPEPTFTPEPPTETPTPTPPVIAIIVGHRNNDSGAVCEGNEYAGLQEAQVTASVVGELMERLQDEGYTVIDLDEFDERQYGLQATALISIHVDSCVNYEGTTGFKVARSAVSAIPEIEDRFVACMDKEYAEVTGLELHPGSITHNMTAYHAFSKIDMNTPAVIIEVGFLYYDHDLLTKEPDRVAVGIRNGLDCFLDGDIVATPTSEP